MSSRLVDVLLEDVGERATQQLGLLLEVAVRDASYDVDPAVRSVVRDLRAWSLAATQQKPTPQEPAHVFRNTPSGVPDRAPAPGSVAVSVREVDIAEAARRMGRSQGLLRRYAREGRYGARRGRSGWLLDEAAVDAVASARRR